MPFRLMPRGFRLNPDYRHLDTIEQAANDDTEAAYIDPMPMVVRFVERDDAATRCITRTGAELAAEERAEIERAHREAWDFKRRNQAGGE